jgi:hypothetical protein
MQDDGEDDGPPLHFPAADLDTGVPCRHPLDPSPYPEAEMDSEDASFPSLFLPCDSADGGMAEEELKHSWERLQSLITRCLETDSSPGDTVDMVHTFYEDHIKTTFHEAPNWSKKSIYQYIFHNNDRQAAEAIHAVNHTIEFLRTQLATRRENGSVKVHAENVKLFLAATKTHANLVDAKRKREQR